MTHDEKLEATNEAFREAVERLNGFDTVIAFAYVLITPEGKPIAGLVGDIGTLGHSLDYLQAQYEQGGAEAALAEDAAEIAEAGEIEDKPHRLN